MLRKVFLVLFSFLLLSLTMGAGKIHAATPCVDPGKMTPSEISNFPYTSQPGYGQNDNYVKFTFDNTDGQYLSPSSTYEAWFFHPSDIFSSSKLGPVVDTSDDWGEAKWENGKLVVRVPPNAGFYSPSEGTYIYFTLKNTANGQNPTCKQPVKITDSISGAGICTASLVDSNGSAITNPKPSDHLYLKVDKVPPGDSSVLRYVTVFNADNNQINTNLSGCVQNSVFSQPIDLGTNFTGTWGVLISQRCGQGLLLDHPFDPTSPTLCSYGFSSQNSGGTVEQGKSCLVCPTGSTWIKDTQKCINNTSDGTDVTANATYQVCPGNSVCNPAHSSTDIPICIPLSSAIDSTVDYAQHPQCSTELVNGQCPYIDSGLGIKLPTDVGKFIDSLLSLILGIGGGITILLIIISGYRLMTSQGNPEKIQAARDQLTAAIVGLIFIIFSLVILQVIGHDILRLPGFN